MQIALVGFAGVIIGTLISAGLATFRDIRRERQAASDRRAELRLAARLVEAELASALVIAKGSISSRRWADADLVFGLDAWEAHRTTLAAAAPREAWAQLIVAITGVGVMKAMLTDDRQDGSVGAPLLDAAIDLLTHCQREFEQAIDRLRELAHDA